MAECDIAEVEYAFGQGSSAGVVVPALAAWPPGMCPL